MATASLRVGSKTTSFTFLFDGSDPSRSCFWTTKWPNWTTVIPYRISVESLLHFERTLEGNVLRGNAECFGLKGKYWLVAAIIYRTPSGIFFFFFVLFFKRPTGIPWRDLQRILVQLAIVSSSYFFLGSTITSSPSSAPSVPSVPSSPPSVPSSSPVLPSPFFFFLSLFPDNI